MKITSLNDAETIVNNNPDLSWDGWNIVYIQQDDYAEFLHIGFFDKSSQKWYKKFVFECLEDGWDIPDSVIL